MLSVFTMQGTGVVLASRFCLTRSCKAWKRRPPAGTSNVPVSWPCPSRTGRTLRDCNRPRRAMSSASSSTLTPALIRRTLAWLSTSLFRGISRDAVNTILVMRFSATGELEPLSCPSARLPKSPAFSSFPSARKPTLGQRCGRWRALGSMHHRNSGGVEPAAHDQPQPLRPEIGWQVRWLRRGQVRIVGATSPSGVAFQLPRAACRNRLQHGRQIRVRAKALRENSEAVAAYTGALAAGEAHHDVGILPQAPVRVHTNITRTGEKRFQGPEEQAFNPAQGSHYGPAPPFCRALAREN